MGAIRAEDIRAGKLKCMGVKCVASVAQEYDLLPCLMRGL